LVYQVVREAAVGTRAHRFREAVEHESHAEILDCFSDDVVFHSPVRFHAYEGREAVARVFTALLDGIEDYEVVDELESADRVALMFRCRVGTRDVEGMHLLRFGDDGLIRDYTEMARPMSGVIAFFEVLGPRIRELEAEAAGATARS
jgi:hypothetical protein